MQKIIHPKKNIIKNNSTCKKIFIRKKINNTKNDPTRKKYYKNISTTKKKIETKNIKIQNQR